MIILENLFKQHSKLLDDKLIYIYTDIKNCKMLYQDLIDDGILHYNRGKDIKNLKPTDLVRIVTSDDDMARFKLKHTNRRFIPSFKQKFHKYTTNSVFAFKHDRFIVINYEYLLRKKKVERLLDIIKNK